MNKVMIGVLSVALAATTASAIVVPSKAKGIKGEYVTAYDVCTAPTTTTNLPVALPACNAVQTNTTCQFGSKGAGKYGASVSKTDIKIGGTLSGLVGCDGLTLTVTSDSNVTTTDCPSGDCTATIDNFPVGACVVAAGKCSVKTTVETFLGLGTNVFKDGQTVNIELGENCVVASTGGRAFCGGVKVGPQ